MKGVTHSMGPEMMIYLANSRLNKTNCRDYEANDIHNLSYIKDDGDEKSVDCRCN